MDRNIVRIAGILFSAFFTVMVYLTYIQVFQADDLLNHPRNKRLQFLEEAVIRGRIIDSRGRVMAETVNTGNNSQRVYPYGEITGHITGYVSKKYARWGLESSYNREMLGLAGGLAGDGGWAIERAISSGQHGNDIILSLDAELQAKAYNLLGDRKGAVVAIEPSTGRVLAMASRPGFNPEDIEIKWDDLREDPDSPLLNRASQGLYPPGSAMKVVTAAGILQAEPETINRIFDAPGYVIIEGRRIEDKQAVGRMGLREAFARSSNYVFSTLGLELGAQAFLKTAREFWMTKDFPFDIYSESGRIPKPEDMSRLELGESAIGQGRVLVTPLNMAMVVGAIANGGELMAPVLVDEVRKPDGSVIKTNRPQVLGTPVDRQLAGIIREMMVSVVKDGTGKAAAIKGVEVAGKTGSAENPHGQPHAWFIGFAPADSPRVAVAVIIENGGAGGKQAAPVAREIMKSVIGQKR